MNVFTNTGTSVVVVVVLVEVVVVGLNRCGRGTSTNRFDVHHWHPSTCCPNQCRSL